MIDYCKLCGEWDCRVHVPRATTSDDETLALIAGHDQLAARRRELIEMGADPSRLLVPLMPDD